MPETRLITKRLHDRPDDSWTIDAALATGAYDGLRKALTMTPAAIGQEQVKASGLRGRGGAGFPAATKWSFLPEGKHPRYLVVNDDEGEPSTFKDRMLTERDPHQLIEGIVIAAFAIESHLAFIYIRGEFALGYERLEQAVKDAYARGFLGKNILGSGFDLDVVIHRGAGAYICGEETGLLESLEGERGMPRIRPPFPAVEGLYAKPTVVNNVETLSALPHIIAMGGDKYAELGVGKSTGTRVFSLSGHVNRPGNYEVELGTTFRELIEAPDLGGGVPNGRSVKFFIPGGASSQWLTGEHLDVPLDMDVVQQEYGVMLGSGAVMVFDETVNPVLVAWRLAKFFAHESCGKCTPCREGTGWIEKVLYRIAHGLGRPEDLDLLVDVGDGISPGVVNAPFTQTTICPLGPSAVSAIASLNKYFRDEVMAMCNAPAGAEVPGVTNGNGERVKVTIDGKEIDAPAGELIIQVAQDHGIFIPRFCWHERMKPVGMCRMCLVEIDGQRGLPIACSTPVADGMVVHTRKDNVAKAQDAVLEFLLINHPLDCPVCDRGGECPLQDQTLAFGPGESRFVEEKRHFEKPIPISDLVLLDRERCIQCGRCTRFADEIAGDPLIDFGERGGEMQVITYPDEPFTSYFSGNTVQICPVGALTATPYRFKARPWDLATSETSCTACSVGCRGAVQSSSNRLVRLLGVDSEPVNQGWLCDKGRFGYEWVHSPDRVRAPMVRKAGQLVETSWPEALDAAAELLRRARDEHGPASIAVLGGARGTNEDAYAWARFAKGVLRTDHVDAQLGDGLPAEAVLGLPRATIPDCDRAAAIVLLAPDLKEELPVLFLRVRRAADELGVPLVDVAASDHGLTRYATKVVRHTPGGAAAAAAEVVDQVRDLVSGRGGPVVVVLGRPSLAEPPTATVHAAAALAALPDARFLSALRRGNVHGALDLGLTPGFLPGRVTLDAGRDHFTGAWGAVPDAPGLDATGILESAVQGQVQALVILGSNPMADFPDRTLARRALDHVDVMVAVGAFATDTSSRADVMLPTTVWGEKEGSTTNLEGRVLRVSQQVTPSGTPMADWRIATELALRLGSDFDLATVTEVQDEIAKVAPAHVGVDAVLLRRARDGVVLPVHEHGDDLVLDAGALAITDASWEPIRPGTIASEEGLASNVGTGVVEATGTGSTTTVKPGLTETEAAAAPGDEVDKVTGAAAAAAAEAPDRHRFDLGGDAAPAAVKRDAYALRLVVGRTLYDAGLITSQSPSLAPLAARPILLVNKKDFDRIGVAEGGRVRVTSTRGSVQLPVRPDVTTPEGVAFLAYNPTGEGAAELIDIAEPVTDVRVETLRS